jgi:hypothetical protein
LYDRASRQSGRRRLGGVCGERIRLARWLLRLMLVLDMP